MNSVFNTPASAPTPTTPEVNLSNCVEVRLNASAKKVKPKETKPSGWRHVSNLSSGVISFNEITGKVLLSFGLFTEDGNNPVPVWAFEPMLEKKPGLPGVDLNSYSKEELFKAGAASLVGWEKIPLNWEALDGLQQALTGAPGLRASFTVELEGSIVGQLQAAEWGGVSIVLTLDLNSARSGKVSAFKTRVYRAVEVELLDARIEKSIPMGTPVKGIVQALEIAKAISLEGEEGEDDTLFREKQYLAAFGEIGETRTKSKAWKCHAEMLGSGNQTVASLAVFCLGQLLKKGALKNGNAAQLEEQYGVKITPVEGLPPTASASSNPAVEAVEAEIVNFDVEL